MVGEVTLSNGVPGAFLISAEHGWDARTNRATRSITFSGNPSSSSEMFRLTALPSDLHTSPYLITLSIDHAGNWKPSGSDGPAAPSCDASDAGKEEMDAGRGLNRELEFNAAGEDDNSVPSDLATFGGVAGT
jgi:hypothetical protein